MDYRIGNFIVLIPIKNTGNGTMFYSPEFTQENLKVSMEGRSIEAIAVLPFQSKVFDIELRENPQSATLLTRYFYTPDSGHLDFQKELLNPRCYLKYKFREIETQF